MQFKKREDIIVNKMDTDLWVFGEVKMNESHRVEYKQTLTDSLEKEVVAFLNSKEGGSIYLGVSNDGNVIGLPNPDEIQLKIKDKLKHNISPTKRESNSRFGTK